MKDSSNFEMMKVILALDTGSSSIRCTAYQMIIEALAESSSHSSSSSLRPIENCSCSRQLTSVLPNTGKIKVSDMFDLLDDCVDQVIKSLRSLLTQQLFTIVGVGFSTFCMNLVGIDSDGHPVGEEASISYACNIAQVAQECQEFKNLQNDLYQLTGAPLFHSAYAIPQLRQFYKSNPQLASQVCTWQTIASYCISRWVGMKSCAISYSEASWTGLFNFRTCQYEPKALELLPKQCRDALPQVIDFSDFEPTISEYCHDNPQIKNEYFMKWPELQNTKLYLGLGDGACANIGSKCFTNDRIAVTVGTSAAARICLYLPIINCNDDETQYSTLLSANTIHIPFGLFCYRIDKYHVLVGGALTDGGSIVEWARDLLNLTTKEQFNDCMKKVETLLQHDYSQMIITKENEQESNNHNNNSHNCSSLSMIPFLSGERSIGFRTGATGAIYGLTRETTTAHFVKSCLEGVTLRLRAIFKLIIQTNNYNNNDGQQRRQQEQQEQVGNDQADNVAIVVSGKALEVNPLWRQMIADSTGLQVILDHDTNEGTSRGVARLVAINHIFLSNDQTGQEHGANNYKKEDIESFTVSEPTVNGQLYFDYAANIQNEFIDTMSPLFST